MKHLFTSLSIGLLFVYGCSFIHIQKTNTTKSDVSSNNSREENEESKAKYDMAMELQEWEFHITKDPATNTVPRQKVLEAIAYEKKRRQLAPEAAIAAMNWKERGPNNVGGRTRAIMLDPSDASKKTLWAAGVDGGLWKTTDITAAEPNWTPINDLLGNLAITTIAFDSTNNDTMYFGTGEGWYNTEAVQGFGIWRSLDRGVTWTQLSSTTGSAFNFVTRIVVHPTNHKIYAGTKNGIYLSTDYGVTFNSIGYSGKNISDIELSSTGRIHIGIGDFITTREYHYTDNDGASWDPTATNFNAIVAATGKRVELAIAPSNGNILYALVGTQGNLQGIYKTTDAGITWAATGATAWNDINCGATAADFTRGQSWYDLAIAVNPGDANNVIIGGVDLLKTTNGGTSWTQITSWAAACARQEVHADQHIVYFEPGSSSVAYFGNDGGVYRTADANAAIPTIVSKNSNYNVTQYYSTAIHPTATRNFILGGAQDNGTHIITAPGIGAGNQVTGGDGGFCHIETDQPQYIFTSYVYNNFYRSADTGATFSQIINNNNGPFITPWDFDNTNNILYAAYKTDSFMRWSNMHAVPAGTAFSIGAGMGMITHVKVSPNTPTTVYFGTDLNKVFRVTNANTAPTLTNITGGPFPANADVSCIEVQKGNENHLLVTFSNYGVNSVYESTNGGTSWQNAEGNLPDLPVRWALFSPVNSTNALLATETGVYSTDNLNGSSTVWGINSSGMPNVRVDMLKWRASDSMVVAATHGRGIFTTDVFTTMRAAFETSLTLSYINQPIQFSDDSYKATSWAWDFDNNGSVDATSQNPVWAYGTGGLKTVKLTINGGAASITKTSVIQVLPNLAVPFTAVQGGDFETNASYFGSGIVKGDRNLWVRGVPLRNLTTFSSATNAWKTQLGADVPAGDYQCALYTPSFNLYKGGTYTLNFRKSMEVAFCNAPFALQVQYSIDMGNTWNTLGAYGDGLGTGWYNSNPSGACPMDNTVFTNQQGWIGNYTNALTNYNISSLAGNRSVSFRFVFAVAAGYSAAAYAKDGFMVDDFTITSSTSNVANYFVERATCSKAENFGPFATVDFYSPNGKILTTLTNATAHNYGLTTVTVDNAGSGAINYGSNTANILKIFEKTLRVDPTTNNTSGIYNIRLYYDAAEIAGWRAITTNSFTGANIIKCPVNIASGTNANGVYGTLPTIAAFSTIDTSISASFTTGFSGFSSGADVAILPVELISFEAIRNGNGVSLLWVTSSEKNNSGFDIERSTDARSWKKISFAPGKGTIYTRTAYTYIDEKAFENAPILYYRLKQIDYNGVFKYSPVRVVTDNKNTADIEITPQPAKEIIQIKSSLLSGFGYSILSNDGREVLQGLIKSNSGSVSLNGLPAGVYYIRINQDNQLIDTKKFVKVE